MVDTWGCVITIHEGGTVRILEYSDARPALYGSKRDGANVHAFTRWMPRMLIWLLVSLSRISPFDKASRRPLFHVNGVSLHTQWWCDSVQVLASHRYFNGLAIRDQDKSLSP